jgi:predicted RNA-binding Zn ribbon-like protein
MGGADACLMLADATAVAVRLLRCSRKRAGAQILPNQTGVSLMPVMDERDKRRVGEQIEPGGRRKAPGRLELLQRFINSHNHDLPPEWDRIGTPEKARAWLAQKRLVAPDDPISDDDVVRLRELREALRALVIASQGGRSAAATADAIRRVSGTAQLSVAIDDEGRSALEPARGGVDGAVATLLGILHEAQLTGQWSRMKACRRCEYAFFDRSKNRSAAWCAMSICGNRTKNRAYYRRRRASTR